MNKKKTTNYDVGIKPLNYKSIISFCPKFSRHVIYSTKRPPNAFVRFFHKTFLGVYWRKY